MDNKTKRNNNEGRRLRKEKHSGLKLLAGALVLTGTCSALFYGVSSSVLAMELGKAESLPGASTVYSTPGRTEGTASEKAHYTVKEDSLANEKATANDLTLDEAAAIGVKLLEHLFETTLDDAYVYMSYYSGTETFPRAFWSGDVRMTGEQRTPDNTAYSFSIDAVTGEYMDASYSRRLQEDVALGADSSLSDSPDYKNLAQEFTKEKELLRTEVSKVEYNCQGYSDNDPDITFQVYGQDNDRVILTFSRYDKIFKGMITGSSLDITESASEGLSGEVENADALPAE